MTQRQKRMLVRLRLAQTDAASMSDRALARELGVSQPFVGAQRRAFSASVEKKLNTNLDSLPRQRHCDPSTLRWNRVGHDEFRSPRLPVAPGRALCDGDPFD